MKTDLFLPKLLATMYDSKQAGFEAKQAFADCAVFILQQTFRTNALQMHTHLMKLTSLFFYCFAA
jgi:hypothetical protein